MPVGTWSPVSSPVWTYESYAAVAVIRDYLAFDPDRVGAVEERPGGQPPFAQNRWAGRFALGLQALKRLAQPEDGRSKL
jgi:hypothetical protein